MTKKEKLSFISKVATLVKKYAPQYNICVYSPIIAQAICESGWGESKLSKNYHNYFGLKCGTKWTGKSVNMTTQEEYEVGTLTTIKDNFRVYDNMDEGVKGYFEFIQLSRYSNLKYITDAQLYLETIKEDGYATSSTYVTTNMAIINEWDLTKYDPVNDKECENMGIVEKAISWMEKTANDSSHGYDQIYRWNEKGDYDCSSAVITAWELAGIPVKTKGATYTGNMYNVFLQCGFKNVTHAVDLTTGKGMKRGDVLLNITHHVAMYCGGGLEVEASINEKGTATGGKPGDQTGKEFLIRNYRNYPWNVVLRYPEETTQIKTESDENWKPITTATSTVNNLYVRSEPNGMVLGELNKGNRFEVNGEISGMWTKVKVANIGIGWVATKYVKYDAVVNTNTVITNKQDKTQVLFKGVVTASQLNVRSWAGTKYDTIKSYPLLVKGEEVDVMNFTQKDVNKKDWYYVRIANKYYGFVSATYIKKA